MTLGLAAGHASMGWLADRWSLAAAFRLPSACLVVSAAMLAGFRLTRRR
jgi:hypothetical protein